MLTKSEQVIIWLDLFDNVSIKKKYEILNSYNTPEDCFNNFKNHYDKFKNILTNDEFNKMSYALSSDFLNKQLISYNKIGVEVVTIYSKHYPKLLKETATPPLVLYCKGDVSLLNSDCIAIVGTRHKTKYGAKITEDFAKTLAGNGFTIVSGLADGIDTVAHKSAIEAGGKTIAVIAGGVNEIYPYSNLELGREIIKNHLLVSEHKPDIKPAPYHFPIRNRIIAGISKGVLITEAGLKSGSMYTKEYCLEAGRDLFVVPGNIDNSSSFGCNKIIKNLQGCIVTSVEDILEVYGKTNTYKKVKKANSYQLNIDEQQIVNILGKEEMHYEELLLKTKLSSKKLNTLLTTMQVRGLIKKQIGNMYSLN